MYLHPCGLQLLTSNAVHRWNTEIQEGINNMLHLLVDLVAARLKHMPVHLHLLDVLAMVSVQVHVSTKLLHKMKSFTFGGGQNE